MDRGEQALLPAVRKASDSTVLAADGFSCKTLVERACARRRPLRFGKVVRLSSERRGSGIREERVAPFSPAADAPRLAARTGGSVDDVPGAGDVPIGVWMAADG